MDGYLDFSYDDKMLIFKGSFMVSITALIILSKKNPRSCSFATWWKIEPCYLLVWMFDSSRLSTEYTFEWRHNGRIGVSNHRPHDRLLKRLFRRKLKKTPKLLVTGLCAGNSPVPGELLAEMASNAENVSIWWRHHEWISQLCHQWFR